VSFPLRLRSLPYLAVCLLSVFAVAPCLADSSQEQQLRQLTTEIKALQQTLKVDKSQHSQFYADLKRTEKNVAQLSRVLRDTRRRFKKQTKQHQLVRNTVRDLGYQLNDLKEQLAKHTQAGYSAGHQPALKILLNQEDPAKAGRTLTYYRYVTQAQLAVKNETESTLLKLHDTERQLEEEARKLEVLAVEQEQQQAALLKGKAKREAALKELDAQINSKEHKLEQLVADAKQLSKLVQQLQRQADNNLFEGKNLGQLKTKLKWPIKGDMRHRFGARRSQSALKWQGVYLAGREGQDIHAIAPGRVVFADWLRGYGLTLIVDHGHSYMSIYSNNQTLYKNKGDGVVAREVVAGLGSSGGNREYGLYFELRHKGKPLNPAHWCR